MCVVNNVFDPESQFVEDVVRVIGISVVLFGHLLSKNQCFRCRDVDSLDQPNGGRYAVNGSVW